MKKYKLSNENIGQAISLAEKDLEEWGVDGRNILQIRLAVEETLLKYQEVFGTEAVFTEKITRRFNRIRLELSLTGERFDPFDTGEEEQSEVLRGLLANMGVAPVWQYKNGVNLILFTPKKEAVSDGVSGPGGNIGRCVRRSVPSDAGGRPGFSCKRAYQSCF